MNILNNSDIKAAHTGLPVFSVSMVMLLLLLSMAMIPASYGAETELTGREIVKQCGYKHPGKDQMSTFTVILTDKQGNEKKSVYSRFWKDYQGAEGIVDKMILFTKYPPDAEGTAFLRIAYMPDVGRNADQWIYLPELAKIRRVTIRDPGDSFLNSDLTYADVSFHPLDDENYKFLGIQTLGELDHYVVESTPKDNRSLYKKRVLWFTKKADWNDCANVRVDYYDLHDNLLKEQAIKWQHVKDAWVWDRVVVRNVQTSHSSEFVISDVKIDTGLQGRLFAERTLKRGPGAFSR